MRFLVLFAFLFVSVMALAHEPSYDITAKVYDGDRLVAAPSFLVERKQFAVITFPKGEDNGFRFSATGIPNEQDQIQVNVHVLMNGQHYSPKFLTVVGEDTKLSVDEMSLEFRIDETPADGTSRTSVEEQTQARDKLRALDQAYAAEWIEGDADGVMALFTEDATLVPHHGDAPVVGHQSIRNFWFDPSYSPTIIHEWRREPKEILVLGDVGVVRGRSHLVWEYERTRTTIPEGNYVLIAQNEGGTWLIRMLTWNDDPRAWTVQAVD